MPSAQHLYFPSILLLAHFNAPKSFFYDCLRYLKLRQAYGRPTACRTTQKAGLKGCNDFPDACTIGTEIEQSLTLPHRPSISSLSSFEISIHPQCICQRRRHPWTKPSMQIEYWAFCASAKSEGQISFSLWCCMSSLSEHPLSVRVFLCLSSCLSTFLLLLSSSPGIPLLVLFFA